MHGILFVFSGKTFIPHAQYSVQPSAQMVEVSIEETNNSSLSAILNAGPHAGHSQDAPKDLKMHLDSSASSQNDIKSKQSVHSKSGVRVKANPGYFQNPPPEYPELAKQ